MSASRILQGESVEEMVRSHDFLKVRQLKQGIHQMKRQLHRVLMSLRDVQNEVNSDKDAKLKPEKDSSEMMVCSQYIIESEKVKSDFKKCKVQNEAYKPYMERNERDILDLKQNLETLNKTCMLQDEESNISTSTVHGLTSSHELTTKSMATPSTTTAHDEVSSPVTTTKSPSVATSPSTAAKSEEERNWITVAPLSLQHNSSVRWTLINFPSTFQLCSLKQVLSVTHVSKLRILLIGLYDPDKIVSSNLDTHGMVTMRDNVKTYDMTVDEERGNVLLTRSGRYTMGRMSAQGKDFTAVTDLSKYGSCPVTIAVNSKQKKIYACNYSKVFMIS